MAEEKRVIPSGSGCHPERGSPRSGQMRDLVERHRSQFQPRWSSRRSVAALAALGM